MAIVTGLLVFNINRTGIIDPVLDSGISNIPIVLQNTATLMPSNDYTGGLSSTVKIGFSSTCTNVSGTGIIKLNTLDTTSSNLYRTGLLNYVVLKNGTKLTEGNITSSGTKSINVGTLKKVSSISDADNYTVYVWISNDLVQNEDAFSSYYGNITASVEQVSD